MSIDLALLPSYIYWNVDSDIFTIPLIDHPVRWYGLFWLFGLAGSYLLLWKIFVQEGKTQALLDDLTVYIVAGTIIGARLGHVFFYDLGYYLHHPLKIFAIWEGGLASHGGGIGIFAAMFLFSKKKNIPFLWIADKIALVVPLAGACIRLGNLMNTEMIGKPTDVPWAFVFLKVDRLPRHPAQLYEAIFCLALFALLLILRKRKLFAETHGNVLALLLLLLFSFRFIDEFFKINQSTFEDTMFLNMGQLLSLPFIIAGLLLLVRNLRKHKQPSTAR